MSDPVSERGSVEPTRSQALRSTSLIGIASIISVLFGLLRTKLAAMMLGPSGIGLIGLLQSIVASASTISGCGVTNAGTRQIAQALDNPQKLATLRAALFFGTLLLAVFGAFLVWVFSDLIAERILGNSSYSTELTWIALAVALTVGTGSQTALIRGMQRPRHIALVMIIGAAVGTALGIGCLLAFGVDGVFLFIVAAPLASFIVGHWYVSRLPKTGRRAGLKAVNTEWGKLMRLGVTFMVAAVGVVLGHLLLRTEVARAFGAVHLGYFQAVWMISATYLGFILTAMGNEYFPRIAANIHNPVKIVDMVNQQTEIVLLIGIPILVTTYLFASTMLYFLFSTAFVPASELLQLFILGDLIKLIAFPMRYVVMSSGNGVYFAFSELLPIGLMIAVVMVFGESIGLTAAGWGYLLMQIGILCLSFIFVYWKHRFFWDIISLRVILIGIVGSVFAVLVFKFNDGIQFYINAAALLALISFLSIQRLLKICTEAEAKPEHSTASIPIKIIGKIIKLKKPRAI